MQTINFNSYIGNYNFTLNPTDYILVNAPTSLTDVFSFTSVGAFENNSMLQFIIVAGSNLFYTRQWINGVFQDWQTIQGGGTLVNYKGTYNAATNVPTLTNGVGTSGDWYYVS